MKIDPYNSQQRYLVCKNPEDREFKFYKISSLGKKILSEVERLFSLR